MGEGLAQAITVGSIVLTVSSLAMAVWLARSRRLIRVGFDVARVLVAFVAVAAMAVILGIWATWWVVGVAVAAGVALGFFQGARLEVAAGESGLFVRRSPMELMLWGAGIVVMQAAGITSQTGLVRLGQTVAWFAACFGVGLLIGRRGRMLDARQAASRVGAVAAAVMVTAASAGMVVAGLANPLGPAALAQSGGVGEDDLPFPWSYEGTCQREETWTAGGGAGGSSTAVNDDYIVLTLLPDGSVEGSWTRGGNSAVFECQDSAKAGQIYPRTVEPEVWQIDSWTHSDGVLTRPDGAVVGSYDAAALDISRSYESTISPDGCFGISFTLQATEVNIIPRVSPPAGEKTTPATTATPTTEAPSTAAPTTAPPTTSVPATTAGAVPTTAPPTSFAKPAKTALPVASDEADIDPKNAAAQAAAGMVAAVAIAGVALVEAGASSSGRPRGPGDRAEPQVENFDDDRNAEDASGKETGLGTTG